MSAGTFRMRREAIERAAAEAATNAVKDQAVAEPACEVPVPKGQEAQESTVNEAAATMAKAKPKATPRPA